MKLESINLESIAIGLYSLGIYFCITILWPDSRRHFHWLLFLVGVGKHISVVLFGLQDYFCSFRIRRVSGNLSEIEKGKNPGGREFRERVEYMAMGALVEGCLFFLIGNGIYWATRWKKGGNVFLSGILLYFLMRLGGFGNMLCRKPLFLGK